MANLTETATWATNIYRIDDADPVLGWDGVSNNIDNDPHQQLADRTQWLKERVDKGGRTTAITVAATVAPGDTFPITQTEMKGTWRRMNTNAGTGDLIMPAMSTLVDQSHMIVSVEPGSSFNWTYGTFRNLRIKADATDTILDIDNNQTSAAGGYVNLLPGTTARLERGGANLLLLYRLSSPEQQPIGMVGHFAVNSPPIGWLEANGASLLRASYPALFAAIGVSFGAVNGSEFTLPDLRGEFIRGWDNARGADANSVVLTGTTTNGSATVGFLSSTTGLAIGMSVSGTGIPGATTILTVDSSTQITLSANATASGSVTLTFAGRMFGSFQNSTLINGELLANGAQLAQNISLQDATTTHNATGQVTTSVGLSISHNIYAVRPRNIALMPCIKY